MRPSDILADYEIKVAASEIAQRIDKKSLHLPPYVDVIAQNDNIILRTIRQFAGMWIGKGGVHTQELTEALPNNGEFHVEILPGLDIWEIFPQNFPFRKKEGCLSLFGVEPLKLKPKMQSYEYVAFDLSWMMFEHILDKIRRIVKGWEESQILEELRLARKFIEQGDAIELQQGAELIGQVVAFLSEHEPEYWTGQELARIFDLMRTVSGIHEARNIIRWILADGNLMIKTARSFKEIPEAFNGYELKPIRPTFYLVKLNKEDKGDEGRDPDVSG